jgi:hypothetical protein
LKNKNYRLLIPALQHEIKQDECKIQVKSNGITITLIKKDKIENWTDLKPKKSLVNPDKPKKESDDAMGDLMGMMKEMY